MAATYGPAAAATALAPSPRATRLCVRVELRLAVVNGTLERGAHRSTAFVANRLFR